MQRWTQDEAIAYECACECITHMRAILTSERYAESKKPHPNTELLKRWDAESARLFRERDSLQIHDHAEIARIRAEYGARIRAISVWASEAEDHANDGNSAFIEIASRDSKTRRPEILEISGAGVDTSKSVNKGDKSIDRRL